MATVKSKLFPYVGGKGWLAPRLRKIFEAVPHFFLISPFLGSGVFEIDHARRNPGVEVFGYDLNAALVNAHQAWKFHSDALLDELSRRPADLSREAFKAIHASLMDVDLINVSAAADFIQVQFNSFSGKVRSYVKSSRKSLLSKALQTPCPANFRPMVGDCLETLRLWLPSKLAVFYVDPPYFVSNAHYAQGHHKKFPHEELAAVLTGHPEAFWVCSYNDHPRIRSLYEGSLFERVPRKSPQLDGSCTEGVELLILSPAFTPMV